MEQLPTIPTAWFAAGIVAALFNIVLPVVLIVVAVRRLGERVRFVLYGALIFFVFQLVTRVPLVTVAQTVWAGALQQSPVLRWTWLFGLSLTAGLFEEIGRYVGYRWLMRRDAKTWSQGVLYGLGHGGIESALLVGGLGIANVVGLWALMQSGASLSNIPADQQQQLAQQLGALAAQPWWYPLLAAWERIWAICFHVAMSLVVLQLFWRNQRRWLWYAVGAHTAFNFVAVGLLTLGLSPLVVEAVIAAMGLVSLWIIVVLRRQPAATSGVGAPAVA